MTESTDRAKLRDFLSRPEVADSWAAGVVRTLLAALEEAEREVAKITENRNEWASRMMELATTEQKLEEAERRIAEVERLAKLDLKCPTCTGYEHILSALHPVAETTEKGSDDE